MRRECGEGLFLAAPPVLTGRACTDPAWPELPCCVHFIFIPAFIGCRTQAKRIPHSVQVVVRDNNIDQALKALKKKLQREGVFREMKLRRHYEKPSERRAREAAEAVRRARKVERKRLEREGF